MRRICPLTLGLLFASLLQAQYYGESFTITPDLELVRLTERTYMHISYIDHPQYGRIGANGLLLTGDSTAFLFDSPWNVEQTESLCSYIRDSMDLAIAGFIPNHWHEDCMGGLNYLNEQNIKSYANSLTIQIAANKGLPLPGNGFPDSLLLELEGIEIECYYPGAAHAMDNIAIWIPAEKVLFPACIVKSMNSRNLGNTADGDTAAYPQTLRNLKDRYPDAQIVVPGHGEPGGMELLEHTLELANQGL